MIHSESQHLVDVKLPGEQKLSYTSPVMSVSAHLWATYRLEFSA